MAASPFVEIPPIIDPMRFILPIDIEYDLYSLHEFSRARSEPSGSAGRAAARNQCQPRGDADRPLAACSEPRAAAVARDARRSAAGSRRCAHGTDAPGTGIARAIGAGAGSGAR